MAFQVQIATGSPTPIYRQIVDQVLAAVATGRLAEGAALPSVRALAERLVINPNTVARAYADLVRDGVADSRAGRGLFIAARRQVFTRAERLRRLAPALDAFIHEAAYLNLSPDEIRAAVEQRLARLATARAAATAAAARSTPGGIHDD